MLPRTLEPEVMDTAEEAADYDAMDHSAVNRVFVDDFVEAFSNQRSAISKNHSSLVTRHSTILDVGTGTALIPIELVRQLSASGDLRSSQRHGQETGRNVGPLALDPRPSTLHITAIDLAEEMLKLGRNNVDRAGYSDCITLKLVDAKRLPYADGAFDAVMSNSIVHHIPEPRGALAEMWRVLKPGGLLFVRDLLRPETAEDVERIVETYAGNESARQQQLFRQSLHAALTVKEVEELVIDSGIGGSLTAPHPGPPPEKRGEGDENRRPAVGDAARSGNRPRRGGRPHPSVRQTSDRHWTIVAWR